MSWENFLKTVDDKDIEQWTDALKAIIKEGRDLGIPLEVMS